MRQRWNDLLFAHWPVAVSQLRPLLPAGLEVDTFDGEAWIGVVPFWMDQVEERILGSRTVQVPTARIFSELNLRTYTRGRKSGKRGVYFFSLDCSSPLAVLGARTLFHLPYFFANMRRSVEAPKNGGPVIRYESRRVLAGRKPLFQASFAPVGEVQLSRPGSLESFLTERYCLFTSHRGRLLRGEIHHRQWPLQAAEAEMRVNEVPAAHDLTLPDIAPLLHFSRQLEVYIWGLVEEEHTS